MFYKPMDSWNMDGLDMTLCITISQRKNSKHLKGREKKLKQEDTQWENDLTYILTNKNIFLHIGNCFQLKVDSFTPKLLDSPSCYEFIISFQDLT
jgi:hypothetical protein